MKKAICKNTPILKGVIGEKIGYFSGQVWWKGDMMMVSSIIRKCQNQNRSP